MIKFKDVCARFNAAENFIVKMGSYEGLKNDFYFISEEDSNDGCHLEIYVTEETIIRIYDGRVEVIYSGCIMDENIEVFCFGYDSIEADEDSLDFISDYAYLSFEFT